MKKIVLLIIGILLCVGAIGCIFLMSNCIKLIDYYQINYEELYYEEYTLIEYKEYHQPKSGSCFELYVKETNEVFYISSITQKKINYDLFAELKEGSKLKVYYRDSNSKKYTFDICDLSLGNNTILSLNDYIITNTNNQKIGICCCILGIIDLLFLASVSFWFYIKLPKQAYIEKTMK